MNQENSSEKSSFWWEAFWISFGSMWYIPYTRGWKTGIKAILVIAILVMNNAFIVTMYNAIPVTDDQMIAHSAFTLINMILIGLIGAYVLRDVPRIESKFYLKFGRAFVATAITCMIIGGATTIQTIKILKEMQPPAPATFELPKAPDVEL